MMFINLEQELIKKYALVEEVKEAPERISINFE